MFNIEALLTHSIMSLLYSACTCCYQACWLIMMIINLPLQSKKCKQLDQSISVRS